MSVLRDFRRALRRMRREPFATAAILATLALGIGANAAVFGIADAVLLRPLPGVERPERLVAAFAADEGRPHRSLVYSDYVDLREEALTLQGAAAWLDAELAVTVGDGAEWVAGALVSDDYFSVLGVVPVAGRVFRPGETEVGDDAIVVVGEGFARRWFGSPETAVGRSLDLHGLRCRVVGVVPARFRGARLGEAPEVWVPLTRYGDVATGFLGSFDAADYEAQRGDFRIALWSVVARLAPDVPLEAAEADADRVAASLAERYPTTNEGLTFRVVPAVRAATPLDRRGESKALLFLLAGTVGLTLLIACANIANLMLARTARRRREIGVRLALGAGRGRLARHFLVESAALALAGGALGLLVARWTLDLLGRFRLPGGIPIGGLDVALDARVLAVAAVVSGAAALLFGAAPAWRAIRTDPRSALAGGCGERRARGSPLLGGLVAAQVALSLVLLSGAGLFWRSMQEALGTDPGFEPANVATLTLALGPRRYEEARAARFYADLVERARGLPDVVAASITSTPFGEESGVGVGTLYRAGDAEPLDLGRVTLSRVTPGHFETAGIPRLAGRDFERTDGAGAPPVAIVSRSLAERAWPGRSAVGRRFNFSGPQGTPLTVVGVVGDARRVDLEDDETFVAYLPLAQAPGAAAGDAMTLYARTAGPPLRAVGGLRDVVRALDPAVPVSDVTTLEARRMAVLMPQRMGRAVFTLFGGLALLLATLGTYGVVAYAASRRTREIGIRRALGAPRLRILRTMARAGGAPVALGLLAGLGVTLVATRALTGFLYGVGAWDPTAVTAAVAVLAVAATAACLLPAARASRIEPADALRHE